MKWINKIRDLSLGMKMMIIVTLVCLCLSIANYAILQSSYDAYDQQLYVHTAQVFTSFVEQVETRFSQVDTITLSMITNSNFQNGLRDMRDFDRGSTPWLEAREVVSNQLSSYIYGIDTLYTFEICLESGDNVGSSDGISSKDREKLISIAAESQGRPRMIIVGRKVYYIRQIRCTVHENESLGTMIARVNITKLMDDCGEAYRKSGIGLNLSVYAGNTLLFPYTEEGVKPLGQDGWEIQDDLFVSQCTNSYGWKFLLHAPYDEIHKSIRVTETTSVLLTAVIALSALMGSYYLVRRSTKHLGILMHKIDAYRDGVLPEKEDVEKYLHRHDEVGRIHRHFDRMAYDNKRLNDEAYDRMVLQKEAQYQQLQQQIQPHFIFNTMSLITWIAYEHDEPEIADLSTSLSRLLRTSMSFDDKAVRVRDELKTVEDYMLIQTKRYGERLQYEMCIPEELLDVRIPQLTIQPLVENSIKYALEAMLETCNIRLFGRVEGDTAVLVVEDNGPGIDPLILEKLKAGTVEAKGHGIGLQNIHKRVQLRFSEAYGLQIRRENGKTQIQVRVPYAPKQ